MLNAIIRFSLKNRLTVLLLAGAASCYGVWITLNLPIDVFPDLNRPVVTVITEAHGLAPEEVETLVTLPVEAALNGTPGVSRIRSSSGIGISILYAEFEWGTEIFRNRQLVSERLQLAKERLPKGISPVMGPVSSIMGEIQFVGLTSPDGSVSAQVLRSLADWTVRPRLMTLSGISQVVVMGGDRKQYQILVSSEKLQRRGMSLENLEHALAEISENTTGGFIDIDDKEFLIRPLGRVESIEDIENSPIGLHLGRPVLVKDVADVQIGAQTKRGEASINGKHSVVMTIQKHPGANTIDLTGVSHELMGRGDAGRVRQILRNLVANAVRYGGQPIAITAWGTGADVKIAVRDQGAGIPLERLLDDSFLGPFLGHPWHAKDEGRKANEKPPFHGALPDEDGMPEAWRG